MRPHRAQHVVPAREAHEVPRLHPFPGLLHAEREQITKDYARILAEDLFSLRSCSTACWRGPGSDKLFALVGKEVASAIDAQTGIATPLVKFAVGTRRYNALKDNMVKIVLERLPTTLVEAQDYAMYGADLEQTIIDKTGQLTNEEYESILRPVFKDDEPTMVAVGCDPRRCRRRNPGAGRRALRQRTRGRRAGCPAASLTFDQH